MQNVYTDFAKTLLVTLLLSSSTIVAAGSPKFSVNAAKPIAPTHAICNWIYARDVLESTYQIVSPGRYCFAEDLVASAPEGVSREDLRLGSERTGGHLDAAILVLADDVEIDLTGHTLSQLVPHLVQFGIRVEDSYSNIRIHNGSVNDFVFGVESFTSFDRTPSSNIVFENLRLVGAEWGATIRGSVNSRMTNNVAISPTFTGFGLLSGERGLLESNRVELTHPQSIGFYTSSLIRTTIKNNQVQGNGKDGTLGVRLHNGQKNNPRTLLGYKNSIEGNTFEQVARPIDLSGSGVASYTTVRSNSIYGETRTQFVQTYVASPKQQAAIFVSNNMDVVIEDNLILSSANVTYYSAVEFQGVYTVSGASVGKPRMTGNQSCGTKDPVVVPKGSVVWSIDGGNRWNDCTIPPK